MIKAGYNISKKKGVPDRLLARNIASENLAKPGISSYIDTKLTHAGLSDENVLRQHAMLINQSRDLRTKMGAIDMYYRIKGDYSSRKLKVDQQIELIEVTNYSQQFKQDYK